MFDDVLIDAREIASVTETSVKKVPRIQLLRNAPRDESLLATSFTHTPEIRNPRSRCKTKRERVYRHSIVVRELPRFWFAWFTGRIVGNVR